MTARVSRLHTPVAPPPAASGVEWRRAWLAERPSLLATLSDRARLRALPPGSFGRAYADFMDAARLDARGLVEAERRSDAAARVEVLDPDREWLAGRLRDVHDLWHVLTGYGRDEAGEANLVRRSLGVQPAHEAHPEGIIVGRLYGARMPMGTADATGRG
jgi:ubiquinone biosynthesis protein COQ4